MHPELRDDTRVGTRFVILRSVIGGTSIKLSAFTKETYFGLQGGERLRPRGGYTPTTLRSTLTLRTRNVRGPDLSGPSTQTGGPLSEPVELVQHSRETWNNGPRTGEGRGPPTTPTLLLLENQQPSTTRHRVCRLLTRSTDPSLGSNGPGLGDTAEDLPLEGLPGTLLTYSVP